jgi:hypothetical protein
MIQEAMQGQRNIGRPVQEAFLAGTQQGMGEGMKGFAPFGRYDTTKERGMREEHGKEIGTLKKQHEEALAQHASNLAQHASNIANARNEAYQQGARAQRANPPQAMPGGGQQYVLPGMGMGPAVRRRKKP